MTGSAIIGLRQGDENIFEDRRDEAQIGHFASFASYRGLEPAEDTLGPVLSHADVQPIAKGLHIFHILVLMRDLTQQSNRLAAQLKDATVECVSQL
jgi:hypothetical protein